MINNSHLFDNSKNWNALDYSDEGTEAPLSHLTFTRPSGFRGSEMTKPWNDADSNVRYKAEPDDHLFFYAALKYDCALRVVHCAFDLSGHSTMKEEMQENVVVFKYWTHIFASIKQHGASLRLQWVAVLRSVFYYFFIINTLLSLTVKLKYKTNRCDVLLLSALWEFHHPLIDLSVQSPPHSRLSNM